MGRAASLTIGLLALTSCLPPTPVQDPGHSALACAACHQGATADRDIAAVPTATCTQSACHQVPIRGTMFLRTVRFEHQGHGSTDSLAVGCAGCHAHTAGNEPISGSAETCGLCHQDELAGPRGEECRSCHVEPSHDGLSAQGLAIPHANLPWIERGCLRCHYEVAEPVHETRIARCAACHTDLDAIQQAGVGIDLHPSHVDVSCQACHEPDTHRIESMSSAVNLVCADCHTIEHDVEVDHGWLTPATCVTCHTDTHQAPQAVLLGITPTGSSATPAEHFMDGLTCRSCHAPGSGSQSAGRVTTADSCTGCHRREYRVIPQWWDAGVQSRLTLVEAYVSRAVLVGQRAGLGEDDAAVIALAVARERLDLIRDGEGAHNLPLSHQIFVGALTSAGDVYAAARTAAPPAPDLGRPPRSGFCSYCHYQIEELALTENMPEDFHQEVIRR